MSWTSSVPNAIDALVQAFTTTPELDGVAVYDGPVVTQAGKLEAITVGFNGDETPGASAVDGQSSREGLAIGRDREQYTIQCSASVLNGSGDISAARRRAYELYGLVGGVLAADQRLGGAVMTTQLGAARLVQDQTADGAVATVEFGIDCDAFTRR